MSDSEATVSSFEEVCSISNLSSLEGDSTIVFIESHLEKFAGPSNRMSAKRSCTPWLLILSALYVNVLQEKGQQFSNTICQNCKILNVLESAYHTYLCVLGLKVSELS